MCADSNLFLSLTWHFFCVCVLQMVLFIVLGSNGTVDEKGVFRAVDGTVTIRNENGTITKAPFHVQIEAFELKDTIPRLSVVSKSRLDLLGIFLRIQKVDQRWSSLCVADDRKSNDETMFRMANWSPEDEAKYLRTLKETDRWCIEIRVLGEDAADPPCTTLWDKRDSEQTDMKVKTSDGEDIKVHRLVVASASDELHKACYGTKELKAVQDTLDLSEYSRGAVLVWLEMIYRGRYAIASVEEKNLFSASFWAEIMRLADQWQTRPTFACADANASRVLEVSDLHWVLTCPFSASETKTILSQAVEKLIAKHPGQVVQFVQGAAKKKKVHPLEPSSSSKSEEEEDKDEVAVVVRDPPKKKKKQ